MKSQRTPHPATTDLLAEAEAAEFAASVARARDRARASAPSKPRVATPEPEIAWEERDDVYRPRPVDAREWLATVPFSPPLKYRPGHALALIRRVALHTATQHVATDIGSELGGLLVGEALHDPATGGCIALIEQALPAPQTIGTSVSLEYTPDSWSALLPALRELPPAQTILGTYHSHPGHGVYLSATDMETQQGIFAQDWQVALVIDPLREQIGFFMGERGKPCDWRVLDG